MRALIVSEGKHESSGALLTLVNHLCSVELSCEQDQVSRRDIHTHPGKGKGYFKRAIRWMIEAKKQGFDVLILVIDEDGRAERVEQFTQAQGYERVAIRRALGVAIREFDAWMLGDEVALTKVLGYTISRWPDPEAIRDPKLVCKCLLESAPNKMRQREMYAAVADAADVVMLEERCPKGFAPFASRVRALQ